MSDKLYRHTFAEIDLNALKKNFSLIQELMPQESFICPMVKSDGYGHGDVEVSTVLQEQGAKFLGVALIEEAIKLRAYGIRDTRILVFTTFDKTGAQAIVQNQLTPVISIWSQLDELEKWVSESQPLPIHIKFNTGMFRLGFNLEDIEKLNDRLVGNKKFIVEGICTHLSDGEDAGLEGHTTHKQMSLFHQVQNQLKFDYEYTHSLNSSGFLGYYLRQPDFLQGQIGIRPGLVLYGIKPHLGSMTMESQEQYNKLSFEPVMSLKSEVIKYHLLQAGDKVSYGGQWQATEESLIGVVPIGYADGYNRGFSNKGQMLYRGQIVPVRGAVCMDYTMVDLSSVLGHEQGVLGEEIVLFGEQKNQSLSVKAMASQIDTISYEIITGVGKRVSRQYIG